MSGAHHRWIVASCLTMAALGAACSSGGRHASSAPAPSGDESPFCAALQQDAAPPGASSADAARAAAGRYQSLATISPAALRADVITLRNFFGQLALLADDANATQEFLSSPAATDATNATTHVRAYLDAGCPNEWAPPTGS